MHDAAENITVEEALRKGKWQLMYMPWLITLLSMGLVWCGIFLLPDDIEWWCGLAYCIFALLLIVFPPFVAYFLMLPRWRIWAFAHVRNVHELKRKAILARILWEDDNWWLRFQIKSAAQEEQLRKLEHKFERPDEFVDDLTVPFETVFVSERKLSDMIPPLLFLAGGVAMFLLEEYGTAIMCVAVLVFVILLQLRAANRLKDAKLVLSSEGITTNDAGFHPWQVIHNEHVTVMGDSESTSFLLCYKVGEEKIQILLLSYGAPPMKVDHLLRTYRGRYEAQNRRR